jgi:hypothetical protein
MSQIAKTKRKNKQKKKKEKKKQTFSIGLHQCGRDRIASSPWNNSTVITHKKKQEI